jgi:hypothetical protein
MNRPTPPHFALLQIAAAVGFALWLSCVLVAR